MGSFTQLKKKSVKRSLNCGGMMEKPLVSIIVPNWNGEGLLKECISSLNNLNYPKFEIIIVDNNSTDRSVELIEKNFQNVILVKNSDNLGFAGACNAGIKVANGEVIALFNNDAYANSDWLWKLVGTLFENEKIAIAGGPIFYSQPSDLLWSTGMRMDAITGIEWRVGHKKKINQVGSLDDFDYITGCAIVIRKKVIDTIGLLDETFFLYGEEVDWTYRALRCGYEFKFNNSAFAWHKASFTRRKDPSKGYYFWVRARFRNFFIHYPLRYLTTSIFFQLVVYPISEIVFFKTSNEYMLARYKGFAWNIFHLKDTLAKRKYVNSMGQFRPKNRFREFIKVLLDEKAANSYDF